MTKNYAWILLSLAVAASAETRLPAGGPPDSRTKGHVLLLDTRRILEGDVELIGDQYRLRRGRGETWVPARNVLRLCADLEEAYRYLLAQTNQDDADDRLHLGEWCYLNGLNKQALIEVRAAVNLRPSYAPSVRLLRNLEERAAPAVPPPSATAVAAGESDPDVPADFSNAAVNRFATHVQPILMNACARCHVAGKGGNFKLIRTYHNFASERRALHQNLIAVNAQINRRQPQASPLLTKANSPHGPLTLPPLTSHQAAAYRCLEEWVSLVTGAPITLQAKKDRPPEAQGETQSNRSSARAAPIVATQPVSSASSGPSALGTPAIGTAASGRASPSLYAAPAFTADPKPREDFATLSRAKSPAATVQEPPPPSRGPAGASSVKHDGDAFAGGRTNAPGRQPVDPFDPIIFNREMHPDRRENDDR